MLNPPGRRTSGLRRSTNRRKAHESPEDQLRALQRKGSNKKCADCTTKLPQCINITVGTFVCMACSGIHRELNMRVKGIGASTFSQEEVDRIKSTNNDEVNKLYLSRYNPGSERLQPPTNNHNEQLLRVWIRRKYHDKAWYNAAAEPKPTLVEIPVEPVTPTDLLGFSAPSLATTKHKQMHTLQKQSHEWDAFGDFPTDLVSSLTKQQQPTHQSQQQSSFPNLGQAQQSPVCSQKQSNFANFGQARQQDNFANFGQDQKPPVLFQQQQKTNFTNARSQPSQQQQNRSQDPLKSNCIPFEQSQEQISQQHPNQSQSNFAYFEQPQEQPSQQQYQSKKSTNFGRKTHQIASQQQSNSMHLGELQMQQPGAFPDHQLSNLTQHQDKFGDFNQQSNFQPVEEIAQSQSQIGNLSQLQQLNTQLSLHIFEDQPSIITSLPQSKSPNILSQQQQNSLPSQEVGDTPQKKILVNTTSIIPQQNQEPSLDQALQTFGNQFTGQELLSSNFEMNQQKIPSQALGLMSQPASNIGASGLMSTDQSGGRNAFDAFANLSLASNNVALGEVSRTSMDDETKPKYDTEEEVLYTDSSGINSIVKIVKVHLDDDLVPFFTIKFSDGREKQTNGSYLSKIEETDEMKDIELMLFQLSSSQLKRVKDFIKGLTDSDLVSSLDTSTIGVSIRAISNQQHDLSDIPYQKEENLQHVSMQSLSQTQHQSETLSPKGNPFDMF
mmetsp:Transcript_7419/g.8185  ORF Transcript_7419/g.8185 Transcript_7419/m.8185 type:complete len:723 (-) Transcript_7419:3303-5471(-)